jgi:hypothetical protein
MHPPLAREVFQNQMIIKPWMESAKTPPGQV